MAEQCVKVCLNVPADLDARMRQLGAGNRSLGLRILTGWKMPPGHTGKEN